MRGERLRVQNSVKPRLVNPFQLDQDVEAAAVCVDANGPLFFAAEGDARKIARAWRTELEGDERNTCCSLESKLQMYAGFIARIYVPP